MTKSAPLSPKMASVLALVAKTLNVSAPEPLLRSVGRKRVVSFTLNVLRPTAAADQQLRG